MKNRKRGSLILALMLILPMPLMTNAMAASSEALAFETPTVQSENESSVTTKAFKRLTKNVSLVALYAYDAGTFVGKKAREFTSYKDGSLLGFDQVRLPESSLD